MWRNGLRLQPFDVLNVLCVAVDTAPWYGHGKSEEVIGRALRRVPRGAYYLHSKVGRYAADIRVRFDFSRARVLASVRESLSRLQVEYIDCMQVHDPEFAEDWHVIVDETLPALEECRVAGLIRRIGITGYPLGIQRQIVDAAAARGIVVHTSLTYCHYTLMDTTLVSSGYVRWAKDRGLGVLNASPMAMGLLTHAGPPSWHPAKTHQRAVAASAAAVAQSSGVNLSRLALRFAVSCEDVASTLFSVETIDLLRDNLDAALSIPTPAEVRVSAP